VITTVAGDVSVPTVVLAEPAAGCGRVSYSYVPPVTVTELLALLMTSVIVPPVET
jgi:hypothetical protein